MTSPTLVTLALLAALTTTVATAQNAPPPPKAAAVEEAGRDRSGDEPYDTPELFGSEPHEIGSGAKLPSLVAEYSVRSGKVFQRITLFDNGVASLHMRGTGPDVHRRIKLPAETYETARVLLGKIDAPTIAAASAPRSHGEEAMQLRFVRAGKRIDLAYASTVAVPQSVDAVRRMLGDLLMFIADDRQVTNPVTTYTPVTGDRLVGDDGLLYRVTRVVNDGALVELESLSKPLHLFVPKEILHTMFVSVRSTAE